MDRRVGYSPPSYECPACGHIWRARVLLADPRAVDSDEAIAAFAKAVSEVDQDGKGGYLMFEPPPDRAHVDEGSDGQ